MASIAGLQIRVDLSGIRRDIAAAAAKAKAELDRQHKDAVSDARWAMLVLTPEPIGQVWPGLTPRRIY